MLTLKDVGIPEYSKDSWNVLHPKRKLEEFLLIRENGLTMQTPFEARDFYMYINEPGIRFYPLRRTLDEKGILTYEDYCNLVEEGLDRYASPIHNEKEKSLEEIHLRKLANLIEPLLGPYPPYFTNNFNEQFPQRISSNLHTGHYRDGRDKEAQEALDRLIGEYGFEISEEASNDAFLMHKTLFPYFISLQRMGFKELAR